MANIASQIKRNRQNEKRRLRNRDYRGAARTAVKDALASMSGGQDSAATLLSAISALDRAAQKGAIHHRNAARRKGRLLKRLHTLQATGQAAPMPQTKMVEKASAHRTVEHAEAASKPKKAVTKAPDKKAAAKKTAAKKSDKK